MRQNIAPCLFTPQTNGVTRVLGARGQKQQSAPFWGGAHGARKYNAMQWIVYFWLIQQTSSQDLLTFVFVRVREVNHKFFGEAVLRLGRLLSPGATGPFHP